MPAHVTLRAKPSNLEEVFVLAQPNRRFPGQFTVSANVCVTVCFLASVTFTVKLAGVTVDFVGLPAMTPLVAFSDKPAGNLLPGCNDHLYGATPVPGVT